jgi:hypothetical protein
MLPITVVASGKLKLASFPTCIYDAHLDIAGEEAFDHDPMVASPRFVFGGFCSRGGFVAGVWWVGRFCAAGDFEHQRRARASGGYF